MKSPLHILHLEDDPSDAALIQSTLEAGGVACAITRAQNRDDFVAALERGGVDLILSDFSLPTFDGMAALEIARAKWPAIPFIHVSGTMGEEQAIESLKSGATDYVLKTRLSRLVPAVRRAMLEVEERAENRRNEEALRQAEERLGIIYNESFLGITLIERDGRTVFPNPAFQKLLGYTGEELSRMPFGGYTHPEDCAGTAERMRQLFDGACKNYEAKKRLIRKDGQVVWTRLFVSLAHNTAGQAAFAIVVVEDITERRRLEEELVEAQKMQVIGQLASGVAHDFNNMLFIIMSYNDMIASGLGQDSPLQAYSHEVRNASERAAGLTRQLLIFSRKQTVEPVVLDLNDVVKDLDKMLRRLIDENIEMKVVPGKEIGRVKADPGYVGQVLMNLVVNARDAMSNGGKLAIATSNVALDEGYASAHAGVVPGDYVMLSVSDTGAGMSEEVKARMFEPFFTTKPKGKGTGLGLATCRIIVQQSGGHIGVDSEAGKGATFRVYFPRVGQQLEVAARPLRTGPLPRGTETLLVVEDDPAVRHLASRVLEAQGYEVLRSPNGQDALRVAREHRGAPIRLVLTDVIMPLMGGKVMSDWLKAAYPNLKVLFTSGYTDDTMNQQGVLGPGVAFLPKPYAPATLLRKVREMLDGPGGKGND